MLNFFKTRQQSKTAVVALHGFGRRRTDEFLPLKNSLASTRYSWCCLNCSILATLRTLIPSAGLSGPRRQCSACCSRIGKSF